jgi:hypothetical protein
MSTLQLQLLLDYIRLHAHMDELQIIYETVVNTKIEERSKIINALTEYYNTIKTNGPLDVVVKFSECSDKNDCLKYCFSTDYPLEYVYCRMEVHEKHFSISHPYYGSVVVDVNFDGTYHEYEESSDKISLKDHTIMNQLIQLATVTHPLMITKCKELMSGDIRNDLLISNKK